MTSPSSSIFKAEGSDEGLLLDFTEVAPRARLVYKNLSGVLYGVFPVETGETATHANLIRIFAKDWDEIYSLDAAEITAYHTEVFATAFRSVSKEKDRFLEAADLPDGYYIISGMCRLARKGKRLVPTGKRGTPVPCKRCCCSFEVKDKAIVRYGADAVAYLWLEEDHPELQLRIRQLHLGQELDYIKQVLRTKFKKDPALIFPQNLSARTRVIPGKKG